jgi:GAF domain-containing protein
LYDDGWRSVLAVPVLRDGRIIGALVVRRRTPGEFSEETSEFLETFASQSAMAVGNAQLFRELQQKSAELQVMSQHKSDFLASMSQSCGPRRMR